LILRKIIKIKIIATRCHISRLKCTNFDFGWGSAPDPAGGAYSAPPAGFKGPLRRREGKVRGWERKGRGMGREGKRREDGRERKGMDGGGNGKM